VTIQRQVPNVADQQAVSEGGLEMAISKKMKDIIINEIRYSIKKVEEAVSIEEKLYYFSAVQGVFHRTFNIEFNQELLFAHFIFNETFKAFQQKLAAMKMGDLVFVISEQQISRLSELTNEFVNRFEADKSTDDVLKKMVTLLYSISGNGNYLMGKGLLKI
jgi:glutamine synthetase adenylyltransferase